MMSSKFATPIKRHIADEIHKPARKNVKRRKVIIKSFLDLMQADLMDLKEYVKENNGYTYILVFSNMFGHIR